MAKGTKGREKRKKAREAKAKRRREKERGQWTTQPDEVSPFVGAEADVVLANNPEAMARLRRIRRQKNLGQRSRPSDRLIISPSAADPDHRPALLDRIAELVDKNAFGRSEMCVQFAVLLGRALHAMGVEASAVHGAAKYRTADGDWKTWPDHAWVRTANDELIDGNIDSVVENPVMGEGLMPCSFWGPRSDCPDDRQFPDGELVVVDPSDVEDVENWWSQLDAWLCERDMVVNVQSSE